MGRVQEHNKTLVASAHFRADEMRAFPSPLEEKMQKVLEENNIEYISQKIFYIYADDGWISRYYIADFYVPHRKIVIEVDGKFHDKHRLHDKQRTREIQRQYPGVEVWRYKWKDVSDEKQMRELICKLR